MPESRHTPPTSTASGQPRLHVCIVYDCLFPWTKGGAERWYRHLADVLRKTGEELTYLTRRQWPSGECPDIPGMRVVAVSPPGALYRRGGNRRILPPIAFALGVFWHLVRRRRTYHVVHVCAFPYFPLLACRLALIGSNTRVGVDWVEYWSDEYWRHYLGRLAGRVGAAVQRWCARLTPVAFVYSSLTEKRVHAAGPPTVLLRGIYAPSEREAASANLEVPARPRVVYAGRHIPEKRVAVLPAAIHAARRFLPDLTALILGDGPDHARLIAEVARLGLQDIVDVPGFVPYSEVERAIQSATCLVQPSIREGYGLVVIESVAVGTPAVVVAGVDNAAAELIVPGVNGFVVQDTDPEALASAIVTAHRGGRELRISTRQWFLANVEDLSAETSAARILEVYRSGSFW